MILPEIGGRIHIGKTRQMVMTSFTGRTYQARSRRLLGPWISGGVEFNWPQHHRPSTYMPVQHTIEQGAMGASLSGSVSTIPCSA